MGQMPEDDVIIEINDTHVPKMRCHEREMDRLALVLTLIIGIFTFVCVRLYQMKHKEWVPFIFIQL